VLQGLCDKWGKLTGIRANGQTFGPALPMEAAALDQKAADLLALQHGNHQLHMLRATPPAVIRAV
jgi:hypothetical protein